MVFRRLFGGGSGKDDEGARELENAGDLAAGDLLTFKHRLLLPPALQGQTFEVASVAPISSMTGCIRSSRWWASNATRSTWVSIPAMQPPASTCPSHVPRNDVVTMFDEDNFAQLWDDDGPTSLTVVEAMPKYEGWLCDSYNQVVNNGVGYYFDRDCRGESLSTRQDDDSEEFRYHECEGEDDQFTLSVEVWGDGETDVSLEVSCPGDVIETMWPGK